MSGFTSNEYEEVIGIVSAILHLGNIEFEVNGDSKAIVSDNESTGE